MGQEWSGCDWEEKSTWLERWPGAGHLGKVSMTDIAY